jgi:hypothetical protein
LIPRTAEEKPPGVVELTIPLTAAMLDVVVLLIPSILVPSFSLVNEKRVAALFSSETYGIVKPPAPAAGAQFVPSNFKNCPAAGAVVETGIVWSFATVGFG